MEALCAERLQLHHGKTSGPLFWRRYRFRSNKNPPKGIPDGAFGAKGEERNSHQQADQQYYGRNAIDIKRSGRGTRLSISLRQPQATLGKETDYNAAFP